MNRYESLFIVDPTRDFGRVEELTEEIKTLIQDSGGNVLLADHWGRRRLAYTINKHPDGYYVFLIFDVPTDLISKLNNYFLIAEPIMRHVVLIFNGDLEKYVVAADQRGKEQKSAEESANPDQDSINDRSLTKDTDVNNEISEDS